MTEIKIVISADESALEFSRNLAGLFQNLTTSKIVEAVVESAAAPKAPVPALAPQPVPEPTPVKSQTAGPTTIEEVRAIAAEYLNTPEGRTKLSQVIYQFGLKKVPDLRPDQFGPFIKALRG